MPRFPAFLVTILAFLFISGPVHAGVYDLIIAQKAVNVTGREKTAITINGTLPGPLLRWQEGEEVIINVANRLDETTSLHWHGILVPFDMDGVPGISFDGIKPGHTFTYRFKVRQSGTYWYHSHSGTQEPSGVYGPLVIEPAGWEPYEYDRDYVVMLSDWTDEDPDRVLAKLKKQSGYYNFSKRTVFDFFRDSAKNGFRSTISDRLAWGRMRMDPTDIADVTGYTYTFLVNGRPPQANWTALFKPGERIRLRFINGSAMTYFDIRLPGLKMQVVQADGQNVEPVWVDELRIAVAETYDVIVEPEDELAYTIFAEAMDRSGHARGTLAPREGMSAPIPEGRPRLRRTMKDMGMTHEAMRPGHSEDMPGMGQGEKAREMQHDSMSAGPAENREDMNHKTMSTGHAGQVEGMEHATMNRGQAESMEDMEHESVGAEQAENRQDIEHGPDYHGPGNSMVAMMPQSRLHEPGTGLEDTGTRVLTYTDLRSLNPAYDQRVPEREFELHLTGNMERYMWSFDGKKFSESVPVQFNYGERLRVTLVNDTMMDHPIHLHGMWMLLDNGSGSHKPRKHTINVKPGERLSFEVTADAPGQWAFHCHLLYHMDTGMMRKIMVQQVVSD